MFRSPILPSIGRRTMKRLALPLPLGPEQPARPGRAATSLGFSLSLLEGRRLSCSAPMQRTRDRLGRSVHGLANTGERESERGAGLSPEKPVTHAIQPTAIGIPM